MKKYITIPANTNSEWDDGNVAVIEANDLKKILPDLEKALRVIDVEFKDYTIKPRMSFWYDMLDFYLINDPVLGLTDDIGAFAGLDQITKYGQVTIDHFGSVTFKSYGKHTGEEYYTDSVQLKELINLINQ